MRHSGAALGASLSALVPADESDEVRAHVRGAAAVASVALCARLCDPRVEAAPQKGAPFVVAGRTRHQLPDLKAVGASMRPRDASSFGPHAPIRRHRTRHSECGQCALRCGQCVHSFK